MHFRNIDVAVFDAMGVTFVEADDVSNLLIPFVARSAAAQTERLFDSCTSRRVLAGYRLRSSGRGLGVRPPANESTSTRN
jgi:hypothetical protein